MIRFPIFTEQSPKYFAQLAGRLTTTSRRHTTGREQLSKKKSWQRLSLEQQQRILVDEGIASVPRLSIEEDDSLFRNLQETPLSSWKTKIDALPQQFSNAAMAASKLLEPRTQKVKLTSRILRTETDVKDWVAKTERELLEKIKRGPIVI